MLIVENKFKTFFRLLWDKIKIFFTIVGILIFIVVSGLVLIDFGPPKNEEEVRGLEDRIEVLEKFHNIEGQEDNE